MLTSRTATNMTLIGYTVLSELVGWPLPVTPLTTKVEPTGTLLRLKVPSGSSAGRSVNRSVRWRVPETSEVLCDVPCDSLVRLIL